MTGRTRLRPPRPSAPAAGRGGRRGVRTSSATGPAPSCPGPGRRRAACAPIRAVPSDPASGRSVVGTSRSIPYERTMRRRYRLEHVPPIFWGTAVRHAPAGLLAIFPGRTSGATRPPGPTTTRRLPRESTTPEPSSASSDDEPMSSSRGSATAPSTNANHDVVVRVPVFDPEPLGQQPPDGGLAHPVGPAGTTCTALTGWPGCRGRTAHCGASR